MNMQKLKNILSKNLQKQLKLKNINQMELSKDLNIPYTTISNWIQANTYPRADKIQLLADYFDIDKKLLTDVDTDLTKTIYANQITDIKIKKIPIIGKIACGTPILTIENIEQYTEEIANFLPSGNIFGLIASGDSMQPTIPDGALVIVREQAEVENGEIAAVLLNRDTEATLKRVKRQGDVLLLVPDNKDYDVIIIDKDNPAKILGKVVRITINI